MPPLLLRSSFLEPDVGVAKVHVRMPVSTGAGWGYRMQSFNANQAGYDAYASVLQRYTDTLLHSHLFHYRLKSIQKYKYFDYGFNSYTAQQTLNRLLPAHEVLLYFGNYNIRHGGLPEHCIEFVYVDTEDTETE